jgi:hypothetical protein
MPVTHAVLATVPTAAAAPPQALLLVVLLVQCGLKWACCSLVGSIRWWLQQ